MKKLLLSFIFSLFLASTATATEVDMHSFQCHQFINNPKAIPYVTFWIDGYVSVLAENVILQEEWLVSLTEHIHQVCSSNNNASVIDIINALE